MEEAPDAKDHHIRVDRNKRGFKPQPFAFHRLRLGCLDDETKNELTAVIEELVADTARELGCSFSWRLQRTRE
jgi:hypothetical protein